LEGESLDVSFEHVTTHIVLRCKGPVAIAVKRPQNRPYSAPELLALLQPGEEREFTVASLNDLLIEEVESGSTFP
jgi:hypothetical protein